MSSFYPPLRAGNELESFLEGAAAIANVRRRDVLSLLLHRPPSSDDLDFDTDSTCTRELISLLGIDESLPRLPPKQFRSHYCPFCIEDDLKLGLFPQFRTEWSKCFSTICLLHHSPLFQWPCWVGTCRTFPPSIVRRYLGSRRPSSPQRNTALDGMLALARKIRLWNAGTPEATYWNQQKYYELALTSDPSACNGLFGADPSQMRRVIWDLSIFYISNFRDGRSVPVAAHSASFLGPWWLFSGFGAIDPHSMRTLAQLSKTTQKRAALAIAFRTINSLLVDPTIERESGRVLQYSESLMTREIEKVCLRAARWLRDRLKCWPPHLADAVNRCLWSVLR